MKRRWSKPLAPLLSFLLLLWTSSIVHAQEHGHDAAKEPGIFDLRLDLGLWTIVVFLLLLFVLKKFAWGPMLQGLHKREERIQGAIADAQRLQAEAQRTHAELQARMARAEEDVRDLIDRARRDAQRVGDELVAKARNEIQTDRERLQREIAAARDQALQQIWNQTANLATQISAKLLRRQLTPDDNRRLVDEALAEIDQADIGWKDHLAL